MKNFKRILSYLMTIVMGVFLFSGIKVTNVSADETFKFETANGYFEYTINNDEITITTYSGTDEELEVPSEIDGKSVVKIGQCAFSNCYNLEKIDISDSVESIGEYAFNGCTKLKNINIPDSVRNISKGAFNFCTSLSNIEIPSSIKNIEKEAFNNCSSLESIKIPNSITSIKEKTFYNCRKLTSIEIPSSVKTIEDSAFENCSNLKYIEIPNSVTNIGPSAFEFCVNLTNIEISNSIKIIENSVFRNCRNLRNIKIPNSVTSISNWAFSFCVSLMHIEIPDSVTNIGYGAFANCGNLEKIRIPNSVINIEDNTFYECNMLTINGYKNSYVENYAKENSIPFIAINYGEELNIKSFTADKESPQVISSLIKLNVEANGIGTLQYKYYTYLNGKYAVIKEWSTENNVTISPKNSGIYDICVAVKDSEGNIVRKNLKFEFVKPLKIESFTSDKQSVEKVETIVNLKIKTSGGVGEKEYKYYRYLNGEYKLLKDWSNLDSLDINLDKVGSYDIYVGVKDSTGEIIRKNLIIKAIKPLRIESFTSDKQSPQKLGTTIELTTKISGDNEAIQYKYYRYLNGKYALIKDWNTSNTITIAPKTIGNYDIYVGVKDSIGNIVRKNIKFTFK